MKWKNVNLKWKALIVIVLAVLIYGVYFASRFIDEASNEKPASKTSATTASTDSKTSLAKEEKKEEPEKEPSILGRIFVFTLLGGSLLWVIVLTYKENRGNNAEIPWGNILLQPVFIAIVGIIVLNALANLFIYPTWRWFWDHQTLCWGTNIALPLFVHFQTKKETYAKFVAGGIGLLILMGFVTTIHNKHKKDTVTNVSYSLGIVKAPVGEWSEEVKNPQRAKVTWGRLDRTKGGICEVMLNKDHQKVFPITAQTHIGPVIMQFKCSEEGAEIEVLRILNN